MRLVFIFVMLLLSSSYLYSKDKTPSKKLVGIEYFKPMFGHIRVNPSRYSESLSALSCGHPVKLFATIKGEFQYAKAGPYEGYIKRSHLSKKKPRCFQDKYPKFYESIKLDITEMFYWGKLNDQYIQGKSKLK